MTIRTTSTATIYLILIQVTSRALTFLGNQLLLHFLSPSLLGVAVQLELLSVSVLYFSRESIRVALQRRNGEAEAARGTDEAQAAKDKAQCQTVVNIAYIAVASGLLLTASLFLVYSNTASSEVICSPGFNLAVGFYSIATVSELLSEPAFVLVQHLQEFQLRARAETAAAVYRCFAAVSSAFVLRRLGFEPSVLPFAYGQLAYSGVIFSSYFFSLRDSVRGRDISLLPRKINALSTSKYYFDLISVPTLNLSLTLYAQSIFKQILTQGDALLLSFSASLADQGLFALASNYGGLLARLVFQPIEESSRNLIGGLLSPSTTPTRTNLRQALSHLTTTLHLYFLLTLICFYLLPRLVPTLVSLLLSRSGSNDKWSSDTSTPLPQILATYAYLLPFLAVNGLLDAFITSVATPAQLRTQSLVAAGCTAIYGGAAWVWLVHYKSGAQGLIAANIVATAVRIVWSAVWVHGWVTDRLAQLQQQQSEKETDVVKDTTAQQRQHENVLDTTSWYTAALPNTISVVAALITAFGLSTTFDHWLGPGVTPSKRMLGLEPDQLRELTRVVGASLFLGTTILFFEWEFLWGLVEDFVPMAMKRRLGLDGRVRKGRKETKISDGIVPGNEDQNETLKKTGRKQVEL